MGKAIVSCVSTQVPLMHSGAYAATSKGSSCSWGVGGFVVQWGRHRKTLLFGHTGYLLLHRRDGSQAAKVAVMVPCMRDGEGVRLLKVVISEALIAG